MEFYNINSIILFGSYSTGESNENSDVDICILTKNPEKANISNDYLKKLLNVTDITDFSLVTYPESTIDTMLELGSLFLWHLKLEGKVLFGKQYFERKIKFLNQYVGHLNELDYIKEIFNQLKDSYYNLQIITNFDLSLLFSLVRNSCIVLTDFYGTPRFGKMNCFKILNDRFSDFPINYYYYQKLYEFKILYEKDDKNISKISDKINIENYFNVVNDTINYCINKLAR